MRRRHASLASQGNPLCCCYILVWGYIYFQCLQSITCMRVSPPQWKLFFYSVLCTAGVVPSSSSIIVFHLKHTHTRLHRTGRVKLRPCREPPPYTYDMMAYTTFFPFLLYDLLASSILDLFFFFSFLFTDGKLYTGLGSDINPCKSE